MWAASLSGDHLCQDGCALQAAFFEALCQDINPEEKTIVACFPPGTGMDESCFKIPYDVLVVGEVRGIERDTQATALSLPLLMCPGTTDDPVWA